MRTYVCVDGWVGGWMDGWMDVFMGSWIHESMDSWIHGWIDEGRRDGEGWRDGWMGGWMGGWMDGWMDVWVCTHAPIVAVALLECSRCNRCLSKLQYLFRSFSSVLQRDHTTGRVFRSPKCPRSSLTALCSHQIISEGDMLSALPVQMPQGNRWINSKRQL